MLSAALFALFFATFAALALKRSPMFGLYLYFMAFYVHPPSRWWGEWLPDLRWSLLAAALTIISTVIHRAELRPPARPWFATVPGLTLVLFVLWLWIQNAWALDRPTHFSASVQYTKYLIAFYLIYRLADTPQKNTDLILAHVAGTVYLGWLCFTSGRTLGDRLDGVGGPGIDDANALGMVLATGAVAGAAIVLTQTGWRRIACVLGMPLILNGLVLTGSRGAFLGLFAGCVVVYMLRPARRQLVFVAAALLGVALMVRVVDDKFVDRMFSLRSAVDETTAMDSSAENRVVLIKAQLEMFGEYPFGSGHRGTVVLSPNYLDEVWLSGRGEGQSAARSSHNTFMTVLTEQGIPGVMLLLWLVLWYLGSLVQLRSLQRGKGDVALLTPAVACGAGLAVVFVAGNFTDYLLAEVQVWFLAMLANLLGRLRSPSLVAAAEPSSPVSSHAEKSKIGAQ